MMRSSERKRRTVPDFSSSLTSRSSPLLPPPATPFSIAILTCTSLVLIKSTTTPNLSSVSNIRAKNPCEIVFRFELILRTTMRSLIVTAVGSFCASWREASAAVAAAVRAWRAGSDVTAVGEGSNSPGVGGVGGTRAVFRSGSG